MYNVVYYIWSKNKSNINTTKILDYTNDGFINEKHKWIYKIRMNMIYLYKELKYKIYNSEKLSKTTLTTVNGVYVIILF
jgi:hypothetical protein